MRKRALGLKIKEQEKVHAAAEASQRARAAKSKQAHDAKCRSAVADKHRVQAQERSDQEKVDLAAKRRRVTEQSTVLVVGGRVNVAVTAADGNFFHGNWQGGGKGGDGYSPGACSLRLPKVPGCQ